MVLTTIASVPVVRSIEVYLLPSLVEPEQLAGRAVVVVDVLRATTTIVQALSAGATQVVPCLEVEEARRTAKVVGAAAVLGGERAGGKIAGFDLGNSPLEYTPQSVGGKILVMTTTNGTRAMDRCRQARRVLIGAFVNLSAICRELAAESQIAIVCAGTDAQVTREDTLFAGAVVDELTRVLPLPVGEGRGEGSALPLLLGEGWGEGLLLNDQAEIAADAWRSAMANLAADPLSRTLRASQGGRNLIGIGLENDIDLAAQIDRFDLVPELDLQSWRIRLP
jgi:2-phosphosulfolactate phosphatase